MKIIFLQDRDGRTLRKSIAFAPSCRQARRGLSAFPVAVNDR
jgi:hypothetical protein